MKKLTILAFGVVGFLAAVGPAGADVRLTMHDGLVTIVASDATVRQILAEWARVGQTRIVNAERISGGPVTIDLSEIPEKQALDILLRSVNGYLAAPRATFDPNASRFDRIVVMPATTQPRSMTASSAPPPPPLPQPRFQLPLAPQDIDDAANPNLPGDPNPRVPVVNQFAPPMPANPGRPAPTFAAPTAPVGTAAPGMVQPPPAPAPPAPGQPLPGQPPRF